MLIGNAEALAAALRESGATVVVLDTSDLRFLDGEVTGICVNGERVTVHSYATDQDRILVTSGIDRNDPSHISLPSEDPNTRRVVIVEWIGRPKFWGRDRVMVIYQGATPALVDLISSVMGPPLVTGQGEDPPGPNPC